MSEVAKFGEFVKTLRMNQAYSLRSLAEKAEISPSQLSKIENGQVKSVSKDVVEKLAYALNVEKEDLLFAAGYVDEYIIDEFMKAQNELAASTASTAELTFTTGAGKTAMLGALAGIAFLPPQVGLVAAARGGNLIQHVSKLRKNGVVTQKPTVEELDFTEDEMAYIEAELKSAYDIAVNRVKFNRRAGGDNELRQTIGRANRLGTRNVRVDVGDVE